MSQSPKPDKKPKDEILSSKIKNSFNLFFKDQHNFLGTYGKNQLNQAMEEGAIEKLLILAELLRDGNSKINDESWSEWCKKLEICGGEMIQCSSDHDYGMQLESMGGAIALLRYIL